MSDRIDLFLEGALESANRTELSKFFKHFMNARFGFSIVGYFLLTDRGIHTHLKDSIRYHNFPEGYMEDYVENRRDYNDPILKEAHRSNFGFHWFDLERTHGLSTEERRYLDRIKSNGIDDGVSAPVFAKPGRLAYFCLTDIGKVFPFNQSELHTVQMICQEYHNLYEGFNQAENIYELSRKETVVMNYISQGKSNAFIALELGISSHTVDTFVRRCFLKLRATNRIDAAVKALSSNLICYAD